MIIIMPSSKQKGEKASQAEISSNHSNDHWLFKCWRAAVKTENQHGHPPGSKTLRNGHTGQKKRNTHTHTIALFFFVGHFWMQLSSLTLLLSWLEKMKSNQNSLQWLQIIFKLSWKRIEINAIPPSSKKTTGGPKKHAKNPQFSAINQFNCLPDSIQFNWLPDTATHRRRRRHHIKPII